MSPWLRQCNDLCTKYTDFSVERTCRVSESMKNYLELSDTVSNRVSWMLNYSLYNNSLRCRLIHLNNLHRVNKIARVLILFQIVSRPAVVCFDTTQPRFKNCPACDNTFNWSDSPVGLVPFAICAAAILRDTERAANVVAENSRGIYNFSTFR